MTNIMDNTTMTIKLKAPTRSRHERPHESNMEWRSDCAKRRHRGAGERHYFPETALNRDYVTFSNHHTMCSWKGQASYYSLLVNGEMNTDAAWYYPRPQTEADNIRGHVAFWKGVRIEA